MRSGRALQADRRRLALQRTDRRAARAVERVRPRQDRPDRARPRRALRVPPRLPRQRARPRMLVRALGAPHHRGNRADRLRPRRDGSEASRQARAPVLALLRLQRLEQPPRGRLGDGAARLRRTGCAGGARERARLDRLQPARGSRACRLGRGQARARRRAARRVSGSRLARELLRAGALRRQLRRPGRRLRRHARPARRPEPRRAHDPERDLGRANGVSVGRVRGAVGRAAGRVLQRPDRAEPQGPVDRADHLVGDLAGPEHRRPDRRDPRDGRHGLLLHRGREGLDRADPTRARPGDDDHRAHGAAGARALHRREGDVAADGAAPGRAPPDVGPDPLGRRPDVRRTRAALPRDRAAPASRHRRDDGAAGGVDRRARARGAGRGR